MLANICAILIAASASGLPEGVDVDVRIEPASVPFHLPVRYTVTLEVPEGTAYVMPSMMGRFDGLSSRGAVAESEEILPNGRVRVTEIYTLEAIFAGNYALEPAELQINGQSVIVPSPVVHVRPVTENEIALLEEQFDASLPEFAPEEQRDLWRQPGFWAAVGLVFLAGALLGWFLHRRDVASLAPPKPPWEIALARLDALQNRALPDKGEFDRYYVDLSAILRYYIEGRFELHAPERTTPEFLQEMTQARFFDEDQETFLESFLRHCDYVKFARLEPDSEAMRLHFDEVRSFVQATVPAEPPTENAEAA